MERLKSIDIYRGFIISYLILAHTWSWGMASGSSPSLILLIITKPLYYISPEAEGFILISGVSFTLSYQKRIQDIKNKDSYDYNQLRLRHILRALIVLLIGVFSYNLEQLLFWKRIEDLWLWTIFQTLAVSMLLIWPLRKLKKIAKIIIGIILLVLYYVLFIFLDEGILTGPGDRFIISDPLSFFYFVFYNGFIFCPILLYFPFYLFGNVLGEILFEKTIDEKTKITDKKFTRSITLPLLLISILMMIIAPFLPSDIFSINSYSWLIYSIGADLVLFLTLYTIEQFNVLKFKGKYRFFYYFSYYSLTAYLMQHFLFYLVYNRFTPLMGFLVSLMFLMGFFILLKIMYIKVGPYFSLKIQVARLSTYLSKKIIEEY
jgi:hypothetical protein